MSTLKLSLSIPYKQRLDNIAIVFEALSNQTMNKSEFEVIVGAMEYSEDYVSLCKKYVDRIQIKSVLSAEDFSIPRARNLAMNQAVGQIIVQMDADTLLPTNALQNLYDSHFAFNQNICVVGQVVGYGNNNDGDITTVESQPYAKYRDALVELGNTKGNPRDPRFQVEHIIPWAFGWTGLIALPLKTVKEYELFFDENFHGWGVDDLEWSFRICKSETPIVLCEDVYAIHLPHTRNQAANQKTEKKNYQRFLQKWPRLDVELACTFGDVKANALYINFTNELKKVTCNEENKFGMIRGSIKGNDVLLIGVELDKNNRFVDKSITDLFDNSHLLEMSYLLGMATPYNDKSIYQCKILPSVSKLPPLFWNAILSEAKRLSDNVILPTEMAP